MLTFSIIAAVLYGIRSVGFAIGARRAVEEGTAVQTLPFVSVIVAARNEESNIARCLESLAEQDYPAHLFEVLVMNDGSTDRTADIVKSFEERFPNIRCLPVREEDSHLRGKARAVAQGIDHAQGEIFATTDADCKVGPKWMSTAVSQFSPATGLVAGFTLQEPRSAFAAAQALDWGFLLSMASASFKLHKPLGCIGNNLFFRRAAYSEVGTYRGFRFSITEDLALLQMIERLGTWEYRYPALKEMLVWSEPCGDPGTLWRQKRRWALGGKRLAGRGYFMLISSTAMNGAILASLITASWGPLGLAVAVRWILDLLILAPTMKKLGTTSMLKYFPVYELYALAYEFALPFGIMKSGVEWKGRKF